MPSRVVKTVSFYPKDQDVLDKIDDTGRNKYFSRYVIELIRKDLFEDNTQGNLSEEKLRKILSEYSLKPMENKASTVSNKDVKNLMGAFNL